MEHINACSFKISARNAVKFWIPALYNEVSDREAFLNKISALIPLNHILAVMYVDGFLRVYLATPEDVKLLLAAGIKFKGTHLPAQPLIYAFAVKNVPPTIDEAELQNVFNTYGGVTEIEKVSYCSDSMRFTHVLGPVRRIFMEMKSEAISSIPSNIAVMRGSYSMIFTVDQFCMFCEEDGHAFDSCNKVKLEKSSQEKSDASTSERQSSPGNSPSSAPEVFEASSPTHHSDSSETGDSSKKKITSSSDKQSIKYRKSGIIYDSNSDSLSDLSDDIPLKRQKKKKSHSKKQKFLN